MRRWPLAVIVLIPAVSLLLFEWLWPNARFRILVTASGQVLYLLALQWALTAPPRPALNRIYRRLRYVVIAYTLIVIWAYGSVVELLPMTARLDLAYHRAGFSVASLLFMLSLAVGCLALQFALLAARNADLANVDWLSGCLNRRGFFSRLRALEQGRRDQDEPCCLITLDIDHFKAINDAHGHAGGDEVLRCFGGILTKLTATDHLVARMGGEEFTVVIPGGSRADGLALAQRIQAETKTASVTSERGQAIEFSTSIGVCETAPGVTVENTLHEADALLYRAKERGRDRIETE